MDMTCNDRIDNTIESNAESGLTIGKATSFLFSDEVSMELVAIISVILNQTSCDSFLPQTMLIISLQSKIFEATVNGEWGTCLRLDPSLAENSLQATKLRALSIPSLPPRLGLLCEQNGSPFSSHGPLASLSDTTVENINHSEWKPKVDVLVAQSSQSNGHRGAISRLAVSQDQSFFVSASHDGTSRVWEQRQTQDSVGDLKSCLTYSGQSSDEGTRINDCSIIENSHSVATAASSGSVHVWRVDMVSSKGSVLGSKKTEGNLETGSLNTS